jgi:hypothetical protein
MKIKVLRFSPDLICFSGMDNAKCHLSGHITLAPKMLREFNHRQNFPPAEVLGSSNGTKDGRNPHLVTPSAISFGKIDALPLLTAALLELRKPLEQHPTACTFQSRTQQRPKAISSRLDQILNGSNVIRLSSANLGNMFGI